MQRCITKITVAAVHGKGYICSVAWQRSKLQWSIAKVTGGPEKYRAAEKMAKERKSRKYPIFHQFCISSGCLEYIKLGVKIECDIVQNHFRISMCPRDFFTTDTQLLGTNSCLLCLRLIRNHMLLRFVTLPNMGANTLKKVCNKDKH